MKTIELAGLEPLTLRQRFTGFKAVGGGPGGCVWPAGEATAQWIARQRIRWDPVVAAEVAEPPTPLSVVELGCGSGVVGITLARLGAQVLATDGDVQASRLCAANAEMCRTAISTCQLQWGESGLTGQMDEVVARMARHGRCAEWIVGGDVVYHPQSALELEVTLRSLILRGGCSLVLLGWCERGTIPARAFLERLGDLGAVRCVHSEAHSRFGFLSRKHGKPVNFDVEFGVSLLALHSDVSTGFPQCGRLCLARQIARLQLARFACAVGECLGRFRLAATARAQDRS